MDPEEERIRLLTRLGRETIIKYGTYDMDKARVIYQEHPFYAKPEIPEEIQEEIMPVDYSEPEPVSEEPMSDVDAAALASQIAGSNFKVGLSQEEVDAILSGML